MSIVFILVVLSQEVINKNIVRMRRTGLISHLALMNSDKDIKVILLFLLRIANGEKNSTPKGAIQEFIFYKKK